MITPTPPPPYYAVIFTSVRTDVDDEYATTSARMIELAAQQDGFLGVESARGDVGITVSYWRDLEAIRSWKHNIEHTAAREQGRSKWYAEFTVRIALVEREYSG